MKDGEPCTLRGVSTVLEGVTPRPLTKGSMAWRFLPYEIEDDGNSITVIPDIMRQSNEKHVVHAEAVEERLKKLQGLYQQELITEEEYEKKKQEILDEI